MRPPSLPSAHLDVQNVIVGHENHISFGLQLPRQVVRTHPAMTSSSATPPSVKHGGSILCEHILLLAANKDQVFNIHHRLFWSSQMPY